MEANLSEKNLKAADLTEFSMHVENAMKVIDRYEPSRPGSLSFTKLEEAMLWIQVMIMNSGHKKENTPPIEKVALVGDVIKSLGH